MTTTTPKTGKVAMQSLEQYLTVLASAEPAPGGGAAVGVTGAQAAALLSMVVNVTGDSPGALLLPQRNQTLKTLDDSRKRFLELADEDASAFTKVLAAYKLAKATDPEKAKRDAAIQAALKEATEVPLATMRLFDALFALAATIIPTAKKTVVSDAAIAVLLADAGLRAAHFNVRINLKTLKDVSFGNATKTEVKALLDGKKEKRRELVLQAKAMI